jgi:phospholipid/cholesterol/gamma-HCH transport system permease protein
MKVNEEIDAMETMAISPVRFLLAPKFLVMLMMLPCLIIWANAMGVLGGSLFGVAQVDFTFGATSALRFNSLLLRDVTSGLKA